MKSNNSIHERILRYANIDAFTLYQDFYIDQDGYTDEQVKESRKKYGENTLTGRATDTVLQLR